MAVLNHRLLKYNSVRDEIVTKFNTEGPSDKRFATFKVEFIDQAITRFTKRSQEKNAGDNLEWHRYRAESAVWSCNWPEQKDAFPGIEPLRMIEDAYEDLPGSPQSILASEKEACGSSSESGGESETECSTPEPESKIKPIRSLAKDLEHKEKKEAHSLKVQTKEIHRSRLGWIGLILCVLLVVLVIMCHDKVLNLPGVQTVSNNPHWFMYRAEYLTWRTYWPEQMDKFPGIEPLRRILTVSQAPADPPKKAAESEVQSARAPINDSDIKKKNGDSAGVESENSSKQ